VTTAKVSKGTVRIAAVLLVIYLAIVAVLVFEPTDGTGANVVLAWLTDLAVGWGVPYDTAFNVFEFLLNIAMFGPLGVLLPVIANRLTSRVVLPVAVAGLALSLVIECVQVYIPGRVSDPRDLVANTFGAVLGALLVVTGRRFLARRVFGSYS
jgi:glycopeptide antibiotics resistance protein